MIKGRIWPGGNNVPDFHGKQKSLELFFFLSERYL